MLSSCFQGTKKETRNVMETLWLSLLRNLGFHFRWKIQSGTLGTFFTRCPIKRTIFIKAGNDRPAVPFFFSNPKIEYKKIFVENTFLNSNSYTHLFLERRTSWEYHSSFFCKSLGFRYRYNSKPSRFRRQSFYFAALGIEELLVLRDVDNPQSPSPLLKNRSRKWGHQNGNWLKEKRIFRGQTPDQLLPTLCTWSLRKFSLHIKFEWDHGGIGEDLGPEAMEIATLWISVQNSWCIVSQNIFSGEPRQYLV